MALVTPPVVSSCLWMSSSLTRWVRGTAHFSDYKPIRLGPRSYGFDQAGFRFFLDPSLASLSLIRLTGIWPFVVITRVTVMVDCMRFKVDCMRFKNA